MARTMLLAPRSVLGCRCCNGLEDARPGRAAKMRRTAKRVERRDWRREVQDEYDV